MSGASLIDRFNAFVVCDEGGGCWSWLGGKNRQGYGKFSVGGSTKMAHRVSYEIYYKKIPEGMMVCHKCDNPECTNPEHLFLGNAAENMRDKIQKGRHKGAAKGQQHHNSRLKESDVKEIRQTYAAGKASQYELAQRFCVTQSQISAIVNKRKWGHL